MINKVWDDDLFELGVRKLGHFKELQNQIAYLLQSIKLMLIQLKGLEVLLNFAERFPLINVCLQLPQKHEGGFNNALRQHQQILHGARGDLLEELLLQEMTIEYHQLGQFNQLLVFEKPCRFFVCIFVFSFELA